MGPFGYFKILERETLGLFDWDLMGSNWCFRDKGQKAMKNEGAAPAVHQLLCITCGAFCLGLCVCLCHCHHVSG